MTIDLEIIRVGGAILGVVLVFLAGWLASRVTRKNGQEANAVAFANSLSARLDKVEARVEHLETELTLAQKLIQAATQYIDRLLWWHRTKRITPMPRPPHVLLGYLDPEVLIEEDPAPHPKEKADEATA